MTFPVNPTVFNQNHFQERWFADDLFYTRKGARNAPAHFCKRTFELSRPFLRETRNAIDIGCRDGEYTRYLEHYFAHTYCFDPHLSRNFHYNVRLSKVTHFQCALGDVTEPILMTGSQHKIIPGDKHTKTMPCRKLDEFAFENIDCIKIDTDGFERKILIGSSDTIDRWRPIVIIEQADIELPGETRYGARGWLEERNYKHVATCTRGWDHVMVPVEKL